MTVKDPLATVGRYMSMIAWVLIICLLVWAFGLWEDIRNNPNRDPHSERSNGVNTVVLRANRAAHYVVDGFINDTKVTFLVDTGASSVAMSESLAQRLGLEKGLQGYAQTANGLTPMWVTRISKLQIGSIVLSDVQAGITQGMRGDEVLLGMSALKNIEFTHKDKTLTLRQF